MQLFTGTRLAMMAAAAVLVVFMVIGASMGMFGTMFEPWFGIVGSATGLTSSSSTPAAGTASRTATPAAGAARAAATATVRR